MRDNKPLLRLAIAIHKRLTSRKQPGLDCHLPETTWQRCDYLASRVRLAQRRGWSLAASRLQRDLLATIASLQAELRQFARQLDSSIQIDGADATILDLYRDLAALHDEFDELSWDHRRKTVSVTTEPIQLEGVYLGEFQIELDWGDLDDSDANYRVIAIDAHPAASNEDVTHPHVQDEAVCEGEGRLPIYDALKQGRLLDFFLIVRNLLLTYNSGSPYVPLSHWHGVTCADCGTSTHEDERWTCSRCESKVCDECRYSCSDCGDSYCGECIDRCEGCDDHCCRSCFQRCAQCRAQYCKGCLNEQERCKNCHDVSEETDNSNAGASLQPDCVGEVIVPA